MKHIFENDFLSICDLILAENKSEDEWALIESDDLFSEGNYEGGYDATEMEFCFGVHINEEEYWFQLTLPEISLVKNGAITSVILRPAD